MVVKSYGEKGSRDSGVLGSGQKFTVEEQEPGQSLGGFLLLLLQAKIFFDLDFITHICK